MNILKKNLKEERELWNQYVIQNKSRDCSTVPLIYDNREVLDIFKTNTYISNVLRKQEPKMICRFGENEVNMMARVLEHRLFLLKDKRRARLKEMCSNAGFFPYSLKEIEKYVDLMLECCGDVNMLATWNLYMEDYMMRKYGDNNVIFTYLGYIEPWNIPANNEYNIKPWSSALKGKKVLVVHPFQDSIREQYDYNQKNIFSNVWNYEDILPDFELITFKAVQSLRNNSNGFSNWFDALNYMKEGISKIEFDVAIIGCGAYGFPLAAEIKKMGKIAIHLGGATQLLFGIVGQRWLRGGYKESFADKYVNEYWVRPNKQEQIDRPEEVGLGCYW